MSTYASPALTIDFARLPPPQVVERIQYETLLQAYKTRVLGLKPDLEAALKLEQSASNIILEVQAQGEDIVRQRINKAAIAVMLPFAVGSDLDNLAALYNLQRADGETDAAFRRRVQLCPESYTTAGSAGAYVFHALSADPTLRDASVMRIDDRGGIKVSIMNSGTDPVPTDAQIQNVVARLLDPNIKPLTDVVRVAPVNVSYTTIEAEVTLYPGPDTSLVMNDIRAALTSLRNRIALIGRDLTRSAIFAALNQEGVQNVRLLSPAQDIVVGDDGCVWISNATVTVAGTRVE